MTSSRSRRGCVAWGFILLWLHPLGRLGHFFGHCLERKLYKQDHHCEALSVYFSEQGCIFCPPTLRDSLSSTTITSSVIRDCFLCACLCPAVPAALLLLGRQATQFHQFLTHHADDMFTTFSDLCCHKNNDLRKVAFPALRAFVMTVRSPIVLHGRSRGVGLVPDLCECPLL